MSAAGIHIRSHILISSLVYKSGWYWQIEDKMDNPHDGHSLDTSSEESHARNGSQPQNTTREAAVTQEPAARPPLLKRFLSVFLCRA